MVDSTDFLPFQKVILATYSLFRSLGSYLDLLQYIVMTLSGTFIHNLEVAIKDREKYSSNLGKIWWVRVAGSFSS